jgi:DNA helicase-2/ATP-dependent DNA helicase PcrA
LIEELSEGRVALAEQVDQILDFYVPLMKGKYADDYPRRQKDLDQFHLIAERYRSLGSFLTDMALEPPVNSVSDVLALDGEDEGPLVLSTIHSAKGLEWHSVFLIWALEGKFPSIHSMDSEEEVEEERRLMYVALTRAKKNLSMIYPSRMFDRVTGLVLSKPSRFIDQIPHEVLSPVSLIEEEEEGEI